MEYVLKNYGNPDRSKWEPLTDRRIPFGVTGLLFAGFNPARQFAGAFTVSIFPDGPDNIKIEIWNRTSFTSFSYHQYPSWGRHSIGNFGLPAGNVDQYFKWSQPFP